MRKSLVVLFISVIILLFGQASAFAAVAPVGLGTAGNFSVLAGSAVTNIGATTMTQSLGVHPGTSVTGFPPGSVGGAIHKTDAVALQAKNDLVTAFNDAAGRTPFTNHATELGGSTLTPGVYRLATAQLTGQLKLNGPGVYIFQVNEALVTASDSSIVFINGGTPCNVYWKIGSTATLGTRTHFIGTIMALTSVAMDNGATLQGRALARTGAVTLNNNVITNQGCAAPTSSTSKTSSSAPILPVTGNSFVPIIVVTGILLGILGVVFTYLSSTRRREN